VYKICFYESFVVFGHGSATAETRCRICVYKTLQRCSCYWMLLPPPHFKFTYDSSVGITTSYGWGAKFSVPVQTGPGPQPPPHLPIQWVPVLFPGGKAAGAWRWPPTQSSAEVKERVELYLYSPPGPSWPVLWWTLYLYLYQGHVTHKDNVTWCISNCVRVSYSRSYAWQWPCPTQYYSACMWM